MAFLGIALMSGVLNVLYLTGSFFMLEIYDRVLTSRSVPTLVGLAAIAALLYAFQGVIDLLRGRILVRIGSALDENFASRVYAIVTRLPLKIRSTGDGLQPLRDLDQVRSFLSGLGPPALFDLPWMPLYLAICFLFHFYIGLAATVGGLILVAITLATEVRTRQHVKAASSFGAERNTLANASRRNAEVLHAMGMAPRLSAVWGETNAKYMDAQRRAADVAGGLGALAKVLRMVLQSAVLGLGAYLVIKQEATAGIIIASSILTSRALAPVEQAIANWKAFVAARQSWRRLNELLGALASEPAPLELPKPAQSLSVEGISVLPPGGHTAVVRDVSFRLKAGDGLAIIGPSASGKSSLVRSLVGAWTPARGKIRLDGAALERWTPERLGRHVGYLPQDVELFAGSVAQNIARFELEPDAKAIIAAAQAAGVHELILRLPEGYETQIGEGGAALSAGQRQRIALARALYSDPFLVVLDEPSSNLDAEGEEALTKAIIGARRRGGIVVVVAHRPSALTGVDQVLLMAQGRAQMLRRQDRTPPSAPLKVPVGAVS
jgi:ATP-binding cassette subfamily C protein